MKYEIRNARATASAAIDVEWNHPQYGWIPFTASPDDAMQYGREIYAQALQGEIEIAPYVPPAPTIPQEVTAFQARAALAAAGLLSVVTAHMASLPSDDVARIAWEYAGGFKRTSPTIAALAPVLGLSDAQIDALFVAAAQIDA